MSASAPSTPNRQSAQPVIEQAAINDAVAIALEEYKRQNPQPVSNNTKKGDKFAEKNKLSDKNYSDWAYMMEVMLKGYGLWYRISEIDTNTETQNSDESAARWCITQNIQQSQLQTIKSTLTVKDAWTTLKTKHLRSGISREVALRQDIYSLRMKDSEPITPYLGKNSRG
jgi:hypothetical protein